MCYAYEQKYAYEKNIFYAYILTRLKLKRSRVSTYKICMLYLHKTGAV